jgi:hypothetical protein
MAFRFDSATSNLTLQNLVIEGKPGTGYLSLVKLNNATGLLIDRIRLRSGEIASGVGILQLNGNSAGTIQRSIFEGLNGDVGRMTNITLATTGAVNVWNNIFTDLNSAPISITAAGTFDIANNIIMGPLGDSTDTITKTAGTITARNNIILSSWMEQGNYLTDGITDTSNLKGANPKVRSFGRGGYVIPCIDDGSTTGRNYAVGSDGLGGTGTVENVLSAYGLKGTWYVYGSPHGGIDWTSAASKAMLQSIVSRGTFEIGAHSWSHTNVTATTLGTLTKSGGTNASYKIDPTNHQFLVKTDEGTENVTVDLADDNSDMFANVLATVRAAQPSWNISYTGGTGTYMRFSSLTAVDWTAIGTAIAIDRTSGDGPDCSSGKTPSGFYADEFKGIKTFLESAIGTTTDPQTGAAYVCNSYAHAGGSYDANSSTALRTSGYTSGRTSRQSTFQNLMSQDMYMHYYLAYDKWYGADSATTIANINNICFAAAQHGLVVFLLSHTGEVPVAGDNSWETIAAVLAAWNGNGVTVTSAQKMAAAVRATPWSYNTSTGVSTRTFTAYTDYRLKAGSPAINAGTDVGLTTDFLGKPIRGLPDIGAYEFYGATGNFGFGFGMGF